MGRDSGQQSAIEPGKGPFVAAAVFCERVIEGVDGSISIIGIYDQLAVPPIAPTVPDFPDAFESLVNLVILLRAGGVTGERMLHLDVLTPTWELRETHAIPVSFPTPKAVSNSILELGFVGRVGGEYWFVLRRERQELTRVRLEVFVDHEMQRRPSFAERLAARQATDGG